MKELSIEEKAKRYDEVLERAKSVIEQNPLMEYLKKGIEYIFPELKESEGEKIRKELIYFVKSRLAGFPQCEKFIAWLEKQDAQILANSVKTCKNGQNTAVVIPKFRVGDVIRPKGSTTEYTIENISGGCYCGHLWRLPIGCEDDYELVEQKSANKVEPKFKVGDKIRRKTPSSCDKDMQVARIEKDYYICNHIGKFSSEVVPFSKESSYELIEQNHAWSEEDEVYYNSIIEHLKYSITNGKPETYISGRLTDWLKSLKERYTWKPSEEQMDALLFVVQHYTPNVTDKLAWDSIKILELMYYEIKQ